MNPIIGNIVQYDRNHRGKHSSICESMHAADVEPYAVARWWPERTQQLVNVEVGW